MSKLIKYAAFTFRLIDGHIYKSVFSGREYRYFEHGNIFINVKNDEFRHLPEELNGASDLLRLGIDPSHYLHSRYWEDVTNGNN